MSEARSAGIAGEVVTALRATPRRLPSRLHYDRAGARLFEAICALDAYYLPHVERTILADHAADIARALGPRAVIIEPGSGAATKSEFLLAALEDPAQWVPIDVAGEQLDESAARIRRRFPSLDVSPLAGDYDAELAIPPPPPGARNRVVFFPGSTIGNVAPSDAARFLSRMRALAPFVLVGVDLEKDPAILERAYDDPQGVTAAFSRNLLAHVNAAASADFDVRAWRHRARWNEDAKRMEMDLVAERAMRVRVGEERFSFEKGDEIQVERAYKFTPESFGNLAALAGLPVQRVWTDPRKWFGVFLLSSAP